VGLRVSFGYLSHNKGSDLLLKQSEQTQQDSKMTQETVIEVEMAPVDYRDIENEALVVCRNCGHLVPKTMMCLYCGAPILFKKPRLEI